VRADRFLYIDGDGVLNTSAEPERLRVYTVPEVRALFEQVGLAWEAVYGCLSLPPEPLVTGRQDRVVVVGRRD
jgi:hypothetical protein